MDYNVSGYDETEKVINECNRLKTYLDEVEMTLVTLEVGEGLTDEVKKVLDSVNRVSNLITMRKNQINKFINDYNAAFKYYDSDIIKEKIDSLRNSVKSVKLIQIQQYNPLVALINEKIEKLKEMKSLNKAVTSRINDLKLLPFCDDNEINYNSRKQFGVIDYKELIGKLIEINELEKVLSLEEKPISYNAELNVVRQKLDSIKSKLSDDLSLEDANTLERSIEDTISMLNNLRIKMINDDDNLEKEVKCILDYEAYLRKIRDKIELNLKDNNIINDYQILKRKIIAIGRDIDNIGDRIDAMNSNINNTMLLEFENQLDTLKIELNIIEGKIEERYKNKKLENVQYQNLIARLNGVSSILKQLFGKLQNPSIMENKNTGIYVNLNTQLDRVDTRLNALNNEVAKYDIVDDELKKRLDINVDSLLAYVDNIIKYLNTHKDKNNEEYNLVLKRAKEKEEELNDFASSYNNKHALRVVEVNSAKPLYKKHKKLGLVVGGLASLVLLSATLGQVIAVALMKGNGALGSRVPELRKLTNGINKVLGTVIGAKVVDGTWILANGRPLSISAAGASLLKSIALVANYSVELTSALVTGVKRIINKMNLSSFKSKLKEIYNNPVSVSRIDNIENEESSSKKR